jgi:hypothetical protein
LLPFKICDIYLDVSEILVLIGGEVIVIPYLIIVEGDYDGSTCGFPLKVIVAVVLRTYSHDQA